MRRTQNNLFERSVKNLSIKTHELILKIKQMCSAFIYDVPNTDLPIPRHILK